MDTAKSRPSYLGLANGHRSGCLDPDSTAFLPLTALNLAIGTTYSHAGCHSAATFTKSWWERGGDTFLLAILLHSGVEPGNDIVFSRLFDRLVCLDIFLVS